MLAISVGEFGKFRRQLLQQTPEPRDSDYNISGNVATAIHTSSPASLTQGLWFTWGYRFSASFSLGLFAAAREINHQVNAIPKKARTNSVLSGVIGVFPAEAAVTGRSRVVPRLCH